MKFSEYFYSRFLRSWSLCNGVVDCNDGSDEVCEGVPHHFVLTQGVPHHFVLTTGCSTSFCLTIGCSTSFCF